MKPETFQDALTLLPEQLLAPVDALRRKKRLPWKPVLATAACLCLVVGLALGYARLIAPASAEDANGNMAPEQEHSTQSKTDAPTLVEVVQVEADHVYVVYAGSATGDSCSLRAPIKLTFEKLPQAPALTVGQRIYIYWDAEDHDPVEYAISPYRIELIEE